MRRLVLILLVIGLGVPAGALAVRELPGDGSLVVDNARVMARGTTALKEAAARQPDLPSFRAKLATTDPMAEATRSPTPARVRPTGSRKHALLDGRCARR